MTWWRWRRREERAPPLLLLLLLLVVEGETEVGVGIVGVEVFEDRDGGKAKGRDDSAPSCMERAPLKVCSDR